MTTMNAVIATTPGAMVDAQKRLTGWIDRKLQEIEEERQEAEALLVQLRLARAATTHADKLLNAIYRRARFYDKVRAALERGYYIIPPFDCQVFAIRTDREQPPAEVDNARQKWNHPSVPRVPVGEGRYVAPIPTRSLDHEVKRPDKTNPNNPPLIEKFYSNDEWREVEFPVRAMKPELIEAATAAMDTRIFDALAIAPPYRSSDPILVGQIRHWKSNRSPLTFFVAWWLDYEDL